MAFFSAEDGNKESVAEITFKALSIFAGILIRSDAGDYLKLSYQLNRIDRAVLMKFMIVSK